MINVIYNNGTNSIYVDPIVKAVLWSGDIMQASRVMSLELSNTFYTHEGQLIHFKEGAEVLVLKDGKELFRGVIIEDEINISGHMVLTCYDVNFYLTTNKDTKKFVNLKASQIILRLCEEFDIPHGQIDDTGFVIPKMILDGKSLWEMMITALTETRKQTGRNFVIQSRQGKLELRERKKQVVHWVLENGVNIIDASYRRSIADLRNQVKVSGGDEVSPASFTTKDQALIDTFGLMQHYESVGNDKKKSELEQLAKQLLAQLGTITDEANLQALGISDVVAGTSIYVVEKMTGIVGGYYVVTDEHQFIADGNVHTMSITLSADEELPTMEYEPPKEKSTKAQSTPSSKFAYLADDDEYEKARKELENFDSPNAQ